MERFQTFFITATPYVLWGNLGPNPKADPLILRRKRSHLYSDSFLQRTYI